MRYLYIFIVILTGLFPISTFAQEPNLAVSTNCPQSLNVSEQVSTMAISTASGSSKGWANSQIVGVGNSIHVHLHYYYSALGTDICPNANNVRFHFQDIRNRILTAGETLNIYGVIQSDNLDLATGTVNLTAAETFQLLYYESTWQSGRCQSVNCEKSMPASHHNFFNGVGMNIGTVEGGFGSYDGALKEHYNGSMLVSFIACPISNFEILANGPELCLINKNPKLFGVSCKSMYGANKFSGKLCAEIAAQGAIAKVSYLAAIIIAVFSFFRFILPQIKLRRSRMKAKKISAKISEAPTEVIEEKATEKEPNTSTKEPDIST